MKTYMILSLILIVGCAGTNYRRPHQDEAEAAVWFETYGETVDVPPIQWITTGLDCYMGYGWFEGGECLAGDHYSLNDQIRVALHDEGQKFSGTAFAHELLHADLQRRYGDGDGDHCRLEWGLSQNKKCWPTTGAEFSVLDEANANLVRQGQ